MNSDTVEGKWKQIKGEAKVQWGKLTDDDLDVAAGHKDKLSGNAPSDLCYDEIYNFGAAPGMTSVYYYNIIYADHSSKDLLRPVGGAVANAVTPKFIFVANPDVGKVDVFDLDTGVLKRAIDVPGAFVLCSYWRQ